MERVSIVGSSASGKTTLAKAIADSLDIPHLELDSVHHQPDWEPLPDEEFQAEVKPFVAGDRWVVDGNYNSKGVLDIVWRHADTVIWLDLSRAATMSRVVRRSIRRAATKEELWNGNRERWPNLVATTPEENIILWTWTRFESNRDRYEARMSDPKWSGLTFHRLQNQHEVDAFVASLVAG